MQKSRRTAVAVILLAILQAACARLTQNGLPTGQTIAPTGRDHLTSASYGKGGALSPNMLRYWFRRFPTPVTTSTDDPFLTLADIACAKTTPIAVRDDSGLFGLVRSVSAAQLSEMITGTVHSEAGEREITIILFHGGVECEWSREFWRVWIEFARKMRRVCVVAIDGANDSMMNYNLMVLGFPTVMRVTGERNADIFRGNRTVEELVEWGVKVGGGPPLDTDGWDGIKGDLRWLEIEEKEIGRSVKVLDVSEEVAIQTKRTNWALVGANLVSAMNIGYLVWYVAMRWLRKRPRRGRRAHAD